MGAMNRRSEIIDVAKGVCIILVVFGHNPYMGLPENSHFSMLFSSFRVPFFFFLAGIFLKESASVKYFVMARADSLLKPFFVVLILLGILKLIVGLTTGFIETPSIQYFFGVLWGNGVTLSWPPLWFIPHLFLSLIFSLLVLKLCIKLPVVYLIGIVIFLLSVGVYILKLFWFPVTYIHAPVDFNNLPGLPWGLDLVPITSSFILSGYLLRDQVVRFSSDFNKFFLSLGIFLILHRFFDESVDLNMRLYGNFFISTLQIALGVYLTLSVAVLMTRHNFGNKIFSYFGSASLFLLIFHSSPQGKLYKLLSLISDYPLLNSIISFVLAVIFSIMLFEITKQFGLTRLLFLPVKTSRKAFTIN
jgi:fucose 4-O-acetylase-like acetyltransferase